VSDPQIPEVPAPPAPTAPVRKRGIGRNGVKRSAYDEGSLDQYLRDISAYPLISRDEEVELARFIRTGDQDALDKLVRSNLRFVVSVAKKYQNRVSRFRT
jgi:RNA polymerase primary sigma factor